MAEPIKLKDYGYAAKYVQIKNNDFAFNPYLEIKGDEPMPVVANKAKRPVEIGYVTVKVDLDNNQTYGVVTYVSSFGADWILKIEWNDGSYDHQYLSVLKKQIAICPPEK